MVKLLSIAAIALSTLPSLISSAPTTGFPVVDQWMKDHKPGKWPQQCTDDNIKVRKDFDLMAPEERKAYTDAIKCIMAQPSQLDQTLYPAAINRYFDYATIHVNRTRQVHLSGFFLTWHRYYLHLFEQDLKETCGYTGAFPYWNWPNTAGRLRQSPIFNGDEYSMSGDGEYVDSGPVVLAPTFSIPHGSGGGCVTTGPFAGMNYTIQEIPTSLLIQGLPLPPDAFAKNEQCLTRDLNEFAATSWVNKTLLAKALDAPNITDFESQINGIIGGGVLGLHSGAHFTMGAPASSIFVSVQDPIWWPLHTMLDNVYSSWQRRHPALAASVYGTETAVNLPPSPNVTLETVHPDWGYFSEESLSIGDLISIQAGPFCYKYDYEL